MPESSLEELWCKSEKSYFGIYMMNFAFKGGLVSGPLEDEVAKFDGYRWKEIIQVMKAEQARHLPGGDTHAQDPWPARIFTRSDLQNLWDRNKEEFRQIRPSARVQATIIARTLDYLNEQSNFSIRELHASEILLSSVRHKDIDEEDEFWDAFEEHFGGNQ
ncbi:hypothetical protein EYC80_009857 [Monilinia laxa]|uniref:Uncharacterized protein n=1 Tax=Monilinia laxa TaxID=61186 RepID=A0A5N6JRJ5_MONLA|nr:hypothetical protein EYC80_009857 [Monilinia laxa]